MAVIYGRQEQLAVPRFHVADVEAEQRRLDEAVGRATRKLQQVQHRVLFEFGEAQGEIVAAHLALLNDKHFLHQVRRRVSHEKINAEQAVQQEITLAVKRLRQGKNDYFRERAEDIRDIGRRIVGELLPEAQNPLGYLPPKSIVIAHELLPSDSLNLDRAHIAAIVTERGGPTAHAAILARSLGIPAITGVQGICELLNPGDRLQIDGESGEVSVRPEPGDAARFLERKRRYDSAVKSAMAMEHRPSVTADGVSIRLLGNIGHAREAEQVVAHHLEGVGLFRTEFMFMDDGEPPSFERQVTAYRQAADALQGRALVIRTQDLGGDKMPAFLSPLADPNPMTGLRGLRFSLTMVPFLFETQLDAIVEAARDRNIHLLLPMVVGAGDMSAALRIIKRVARGRKLPPIGAMIETPSALFALDSLVEMSDFLSIGSNDLTQFMLGADRHAAEFLDSGSVLHPTVLQAIHAIAMAGQKTNKSVSICGEAAGDPSMVGLLIGLGLRELSMSAYRSIRVRYTIRQMRMPELEAVARKALTCPSQDAVRELLNESKLLNADRESPPGEQGREAKPGRSGKKTDENVRAIDPS